MNQAHDGNEAARKKISRSSLPEMDKGTARCRAYLSAGELLTFLGTLLTGLMSCEL